MSRKKSKKTIDTRPRNWVVPLMVENTKSGPMKDRKKEDSKKKCRRPIDAREI